jgi:type IV secretion system protein TrbL
VFSGFVTAVLINYQTWSHWLIDIFQGIGGSVGGQKLDALAPLDTAFDILNMIYQKMDISGPGDLAVALGFLIVGFVIIVCFALITAQIVFVLCESYVACSAAIILLGIGGGGGIFKDYAVNAMRYALSVAFKLFVLNLLLSLGMQFIKQMGSTVEVTFTDVTSVAASAIILLSLVKSIPDVCAGLIQGSHVGSGASLGASVRTIVSAAAMGGAAMMMKNAVQGGFQFRENVKTASELANMKGNGGLLGTGKELWNAHKDAKPTHGHKMGQDLRAKIADFQMQASKKTDGQGGA